LLICASPIVAAPDPNAVREGIEWCDVWIPSQGKSKLPRVLLIGDSITRAYYPGVVKELKDQALVGRLCTSKSIGDPAFLRELNTFLAGDTFDVIHINNGMHGWGYSEAQYGRDFPAVLNALRTAMPKARIIWALTTPVRQDKAPGPTNARVQARNVIATDFSKKNAIPVDDLYSLVQPNPALHSDDVHFGAEGQTLQAAQVAKSIRPLLK
jgi:lysophospholipase L1-like esterase